MNVLLLGLAVLCVLAASEMYNAVENEVDPYVPGQNRTGIEALAIIGCYVWRASVTARRRYLAIWGLIACATILLAIWSSLVETGTDDVVFCLTGTAISGFMFLKRWIRYRASMQPQPVATPDSAQQE